MADKKGRALERVVAALQCLASDDNNLSIESPGSLVDRDTGAPREIDVLIKYRNGNHITSIGIECRDKSRPTSVNEIEGYAAKCSALDIDKAVFVSASGFSRTAVLKASAKGILLQSIERSVSFDWLELAGVVEDYIVFRSIELRNDYGSKIKAIIDRKNRRLSSSDIMDFVGFELLRTPTKWKHGDGFHNSKTSVWPLNRVELRLKGIKRAVNSSGVETNERSFNIQLEFEFHRQFTTFGYFINRAIAPDDLGDINFARLRLAARRADAIDDLVVHDGRRHLIDLEDNGTSDQTSI